MEDVLSILLAISAGLLAVPVILFSIEVVAATILPNRPCRFALPTDSRPRIAVLVPAHNESAGLPETITTQGAIAHRRSPFGCGRQLH